jgi:hypothetical protein
MQSTEKRDPILSLRRISGRSVVERSWRLQRELLFIRFGKLV